MPQAESLVKNITIPTEDQDNEYYDTMEEFRNLSQKDVVDQEVLNEHNLLFVEKTENYDVRTYKLNCSHITPLILNTSPYEGQRKIKTEHVDDLKQSIDMNKRLMNPISLLVIKDRTDSCYLVFDGQHRLEALHELIKDNPKYVENNSIKGIQVNVFYINRRISLTLGKLFSSFNLSIRGNPISILKYNFSHKLAKIINAQFPNNLSIDYLTTTLIKTGAFEKYVKKTKQEKVVKKKTPEGFKFPNRKQIIREINNINRTYNAFHPKKFSKIIGVDLDDKANVKRFQEIDEKEPRCRLVLDDTRFTWVNNLIDKLN